MQKPESLPKHLLKKWLSYKWLVKNFPFFLFLSLLAVLYIYNGHYADKTVRNINRESALLKELQYEYKTLKSDVMNKSKQSELIKSVTVMGLMEMTRPPYILKDSVAEN